jgi:phosphatidylglycerophosphatase A
MIVVRKWIVTLGGAGLLPFGPGTWGSALTAIVLWAIYTLPGGMSTPVWNCVLIAGMLTTSALCVKLGPWAIVHFKQLDPGAVVIDEAAGICLTLLLLPIAPGKQAALTIFVAFVAFRIFDITKPPPARQLEMLPAGWGILLDDLAAAVYANILCQIVLRLVPGP